MDTTSYLVAKKYVDKLSLGLGALKGKNVTISDVIDTPEYTYINFLYYDENNIAQQAVVSIPNGRSPHIEEAPGNNEKTYKLQVFNPDGTNFITDNLKGKSGVGGGFKAYIRARINLNNPISVISEEEWINRTTTEEES